VENLAVAWWKRGVRCLIALLSVAAGLIVPFLAVAQVIVWTSSDEKGDGSDMGLGLYAAMFGIMAGLLGMVIAAVLTARWFRRHPWWPDQRSA
jgi:hypothetical protein